MLDGDEEVLFQRISRGGLPDFLTGDSGQSPREKFSEMYRKRRSEAKKLADLVFEPVPENSAVENAGQLMTILLLE